MAITKNKLVKEFQNWGKAFKVEFTIKVTKLPTKTWTNVFHFTANNGDRETYGDRIPGLWIHNSGNFYVCSAVSGITDYAKFVNLELGKEHQMTIQQLLEVDSDQGTSRYWYEIILDGESKFLIENRQPKSFANVKLYASDPWYEPFSSDLGHVCIINTISRDFQSFLDLSGDWAL